MALLDELREELQKESNDEQADVHAVDISIRCHYHLIISKGVETFFNVEGCLEQIELLIFVHHFLRQAKAVQWLTTQRENGLCIDITTLSDAAAGRVTLRNKNARLFLTVILCIREVDAAVAQLTIMQIGFLGTVTSQLGDASHRLALTFRFLDFTLNDLSYILMDMQIVVDLLLNEVAYIFINCVTIGRHHRRTQLDFRLTLEDGLLDINGDGSDNTCTNVAILIFTKELLNRLGNMLLKSTLMCTALSGVLTIHEGIVFLAILVGMCKGNLNILPFQMNDRIQSIVRHTVL